jgi:hypothetical protein
LGAPLIFLDFLKGIRLAHSSATTFQTSATSVRLQVTSMGLPFQESLRAHLLDGTDDSCDRCPPASQSAHKSAMD